jgi:hypothetical protein
MQSKKKSPGRAGASKEMSMHLEIKVP